MLAVAFAAALAQQLPESPDGTFEFDVVPGWRSGTKVAFQKRGPRPVVFVLREKRHPRLSRSGADLIFHARCSRRRALEGTASVTAIDLAGRKHRLDVSVDEAEAHAKSVTIVVAGLGLPKKDGERGDLLVVVRLDPPPVQRSHPQMGAEGAQREYR